MTLLASAQRLLSPAHLNCALCIDGVVPVIKITQRTAGADNFKNTNNSMNALCAVCKSAGDRKPFELKQECHFSHRIFSVQLETPLMDIVLLLLVHNVCCL
ncbi:hypothetical protein CEXT_170281 [Caerostris extrusa]|uniref:Uncharacterized protein n=1 Tax=Caerostris extrusa TaxID=172846 RepID=A0AAV4U5Y7_CAEEX|nr:hypothetical protein CEXT_170281 [Caerostris extrusa]